MSKRIFLSGILLILCLSIVLPAAEGFAAEDNVRVTLPGFTVKLNGNRVDNQYREYPFLLYKDVTYLPMTWYDCRLLGLKTEWTQEEGLKVFQSKVTSSYRSYQTKQRNSKSYNATIPEFKITVNGKPVDNEKEEYPLLSFRNVTYFPLTWRFAHDEFGWEYVWDDSEGLAISSNNPQLKKVDLPEYAGKNDIALFEGYYYFTETEGETNRIYRVPENDTEAREQVYSYNWNSDYIFRTYLQFDIRDDQLWLSYHIGGATMGHDVYCRVNEDGKATVELAGYLDFKSAPGGLVIIQHYVPPGWNNLKFLAVGQEMKDGKSIGDPDLVYGWRITVDETGRLYSANYSTTVIGNEVYVLASSHPVEKRDLNKIYRIDLSTDETVKITDSEVRDFKIINDRLYYVKNEGKNLYSSNLNGTGERKLSDYEVAVNNGWYGEIDGSIYYTASKTEGELNLYRAELSEEDTLVLEEPLESVQLADGKIICKLMPGEDYGVKVLDKSGALDLAIADQVSNVFAYNDRILIVSAEDNSIKLVE